MDGRSGGEVPMRRALRQLGGWLLACLLVPPGAVGQAPPPARPDSTAQPAVYVVGYAHLDTQWRWEYPQVIGEFIPNTMHRNFALFEKYPHYVFNFSGANRYRMMREYYPADFARVKAHVLAGRWFPSGSSMEENDVNVPSAESILRQLLYGSEFFRHEFGSTSAEFMLPDCFGFPASLPSILAHAGIIGFSTQKLTWHSANGIPFNVGVWEGPDGRGVIAALNPGSYTSRVQEDLSRSPEWLSRVREDGRRSGLFADYHYYGVGDQGGAPTDSSVMWVERSVTAGGPLRVVSSTAEQMFRDITPEQRSRLPRYHGDLLLIEHSAGSITSEAYQKRWNHENELLAGAAERASVAAAWLGGRAYPLARLNDAWTLVMGGQFHDILPGTSTPKAYQYSWNDQVIALNQFAGVLGDAAAAVASRMNTTAQGTAVLVYNPLSIPREDVVEATVRFPGGVPAAVRVVGPDGRAMPGQLAATSDSTATVLFRARVPSVGFAVYDVRAADRSPLSAGTELAVTDSSLENARYRIRLDANGDVASIVDKALRRELLAGPARLAFQHEKPTQWPAWNMDWADQRQPPRGYLGGPARVRVVERGPVRVALEIAREADSSRFVQTIRLAAGDAGNRIEIASAIDWKTAETALKATFVLTAANPVATYNWEVGTIERASNDSTKYEVPSHQWLDLTDRSGGYGVTLLTGHKYGSDKPDERTLRLTLIYTPGISGAYEDQGTQDWGHHEFLYGLAGHAGDWRRERSEWQAERLDQPLIAFESAKHEGTLGRSFSLLRTSSDRVRVLAVKRAEESDEVIVRLVELDGRPAPNAGVFFAAPIVAAREVDGREMPVGDATVTRGALVTSFTPYQLRSFAVRLGAAPAEAASPRPRWQAVPLPYDRSVASVDSARSAGGFDAAGRALAAEMLPDSIAYGGVGFRLAAPSGLDAVVAQGQTIPLPPGAFNRLYLLAASADGDRQAAFRVGDSTVQLTVQDWGGYIGQWDNRLWNKVPVPLPPEPAPEDTSRAARRARFILTRARAGTPVTRDVYAGLTPGFIKRASVAWFASHRHSIQGANEPYAYSYLFAYAVDLPMGARTLTLPADDRIRVLAVTVSDERGAVRPAQALYDTLPR
jgi:alpha-mannosidase